MYLCRAKTNKLSSNTKKVNERKGNKSKNSDNISIKRGEVVRSEYDAVYCSPYYYYTKMNDARSFMHQLAGFGHHQVLVFGDGTNHHFIIRGIIGDNNMRIARTTSIHVSKIFFMIIAGHVAYQLMCCCLSHHLIGMLAGVQMVTTIHAVGKRLGICDTTDYRIKIDASVEN